MDPNMDCAKNAPVSPTNRPAGVTPNATPRPFLLPKRRGTTFSTSLTPPFEGDVRVSGVSGALHQPIGHIIPHLSKSFALHDWKQIDLTKFLSALPWTGTSTDGFTSATFDQDQRTISIRGVGNNAQRVAIGYDDLTIKLVLNGNFQIERISVETGPYQNSLSRSTLSLILKTTGFFDQFPLIGSIISTQCVLEPYTDELRHKEALAYREFPFLAIERLMFSEIPLSAVDGLLELQHSKSLEIRRQAVEYLGYLSTKKGLPEEQFLEYRERFFVEDVREDLIFIERTLRNNSQFLDDLLVNLGARRRSPEELNGTRIDVSYSARGCNKQIYVVDFQFTDGARLRCAITAIRDGQLGQSDFERERIDRALTYWKELLAANCESMVKFGASTWHYEWRPRKLHMHNGICETIRVFENHIMLVGREFIDNGDPGNIALHKATSAAQRRIICEEIARTYWKIWMLDNDRNRGTFFTTPRAEDVVWCNSRNGFAVIDPDTLERETPLPKATEYFLRYDYYNRALIDRARASLRPLKS